VKRTIEVLNQLERDGVFPDMLSVAQWALEQIAEGLYISGIMD